MVIIICDINIYQGEEDQRKPLKYCDPSGRDHDSGIPIPRTPSTKITSSSATPRRDFYYTYV